MSEPKIYDWANAEEAASFIAQVRREALKEAARAVCVYCQIGRPGGNNYEGVYKHRDVNGYLTSDCHASEVHKLIAADQQGQGQEKGERSARMMLYLICVVVGMVTGAAVYCAGHWVGYDKGYKDCREYVEDVHRIQKGW